MPYPFLSRRRSQDLANGILEVIASGGDPVELLSDEQQAGVEHRNGCDYDRSKVERASALARKELWPDRSNHELNKGSETEKTGLEAVMAERVHEALKEESMRCLEDEGFWRYVALFPFRWYLLAREPELKPQDFGGERKLVSEGGEERYLGTAFKNQLLPRTFFWGQSAYDGEEDGSGYSRATKIPSGGPPSPIDVWHSHIIRVQTGQLGRIPNAFIDVVVMPNPDPASTDEARELAKLVARMKHTVLLDGYELSEADALLTEQLEAAKVLLNGRGKRREKTNKKAAKKTKHS